MCVCVHYKCQLANKITHASLYRMSQKSLFTYTTKDKTSSFLALMLKPPPE